jgi:hypothetical protein
MAFALISQEKRVIFRAPGLKGYTQRDAQDLQLLHIILDESDRQVLAFGTREAHNALQLFSFPTATGNDELDITSIQKLPGMTSQSKFVPAIYTSSSGRLIQRNVLIAVMEGKTVRIIRVGLAVSAEATLVNANPPHPESASFSMYEYQSTLVGGSEDKSTLVGGSENKSTDVVSILSGDDISQTETTASMVVYQHVATDIIKEALLSDSELSCTYKEAVKRVGQDRFLRNNRKLLQLLSRDLKTSQLLPSEQMAIRFLGGYRGSRLVCTAICHELVEANLGHQKQMQFELNGNKRMMLNRFLNEAHSTEQFGILETPPVQSRDGDHSRDDGHSSDDEHDEDFGEDIKESGTETLEATVKFLVSGQPFQVYKQRLHDWLYPPLLALESKQDGAANTDFSPKDVTSTPGLTVPNGATNVLLAGDAVFRHTEYDLSQAEGYKLSETKGTAPPTLSSERDNLDRYNLVEDSLGLVATATLSSERDDLDRYELVEDSQDLIAPPIPPSKRDDLDGYELVKDSQDLIAPPIPPSKSDDLDHHELLEDSRGLVAPPTLSSERLDRYELVEDSQDLIAPPIPPSKSDDLDHHELLEDSRGLAATVQSNAPIHDPVFCLSLPLLVDKILRNLPLPVLEPAVREGRTRIYWKSVRCNL